MFENISNQVCAQLLSLIAAYSDQMLERKNHLPAPL